MATTTMKEPETGVRTCPECGEEIHSSHESTQNECCNNQWIRLQIERCYA